MLLRYEKRGETLATENVEELVRGLGVKPLTAELLVLRGIRSVEQAMEFMTAGLDSLHDPFLLPDMEQAVARIHRALDAGERMVVYGDYDADGVSATALLTQYLRSCGGQVSYYIPSRHHEGYGLNKPAIKELAGQGFPLLISVDCGITNGEEIALAKSLSMDVIVCDHHQCPDVLPDCAAVLNSKRKDSVYPYADLCGAGVAVKLVQALGGKAAVMEAIDLAALATVADLVPLTGENRVIVRLGMREIQNARRPGMIALKEVSGMKGKVEAYHLAFQLGPRINAGGRMDLSRKSVEMMLEDDLDKARSIAVDLDADNTLRKNVDSAIFAQAVERMGDYDFDSRRSIVLYEGSWNTGVIGIAASRLVERYGRPVVLFGDGEDGVCYGSARSIPGVNIHQAFTACSEHMVRFGGHEQAAGCAMLPQDIPGFAAQLDAYLRETYEDRYFLPARQYDREVELEQLSVELVRELMCLEPTGLGNPKPVLLLKNLRAQSVRTIGEEGKHLKLAVGKQRVDAICFNHGFMAPALSSCRCYDMLFTPGTNSYPKNAPEILQLMVSSLRVQQDIPFTKGLLPCRWRQFFYAGRGHYEVLAENEFLTRLEQSVSRSPWGSLILCHDPISAQRIGAFLAEQRLNDDIYYEKEILKLAVRGENALVLDPDINRLPLQSYREVFIDEYGVDEQYWGAVAGQLKEGSACIIIKRIPSGDEFTAAISGFGRQSIASVYRELRSKGENGRTVAVENYVSKEIPLWQLELSLAVLEELGLVKAMDKGGYSLVQEARKRDLEDSLLFQRLMAYQEGLKQGLREA